MAVVVGLDHDALGGVADAQDPKDSPPGVLAIGARPGRSSFISSVSGMSEMKLNST